MEEDRIPDGKSATGDGRETILEGMEVGLGESNEVEVSDGGKRGILRIGTVGIVFLKGKESS